MGIRVLSVLLLQSKTVGSPSILLHAGPLLLASPAVGLDSPVFQKTLKQLMLRVHPDRVAGHAHPDAARANEASFKILNNYLHELRGDGGSPTGQYHLDFYVESSPVQPLPAWQDLTANESNLVASAKMAQDPRYWQPGQEDLHDAYSPQVRACCILHSTVPVLCVPTIVPEQLHPSY